MINAEELYKVVNEIKSENPNFSGPTKEMSLLFRAKMKVGNSFMDSFLAHLYAAGYTTGEHGKRTWSQKKEIPLQVIKDAIVKIADIAKQRKKEYDAARGITRKSRNPIEVNKPVVVANTDHVQKAVILLKGLGYRIMKPKTEWEEV